MSLTHVDPTGQARMVDVGEKSPSRRVAIAEGRVRMSPEAFALVRENAVAKGDVLRVAEVAGTMGGKAPPPNGSRGVGAGAALTAAPGRPYGSPVIPAFVAGVAAGYGIAIPVGAIAILIMETGLRRGFR